jgi:quinone-modifying oxidoreductase subunit QmoC
MSTRVDPGLARELEDYGAVGIESCFNCGNCTAVCPLTDDRHAFPRDVVRMAQLGLREQLKASLDPWLCYYCGDCSVTCPRQAEPAETLMSVRRWLTAQFDWTGLATKFYTSKTWELGSMGVVGLLVALAFVLYHGPVLSDSVALNAFAPAHFIHIADWVMAIGLLVFVAGNVLRMHQSVMKSDDGRRPPLSLYLSEAWRLAYHFATQPRFATCGDDEQDPSLRGQKRLNWISHLLLVSGYVIMLVMVLFFLPWFQTDEIYPITNPQRWLGYYATAVLLFGGGYALWSRLKKSGQLHRFSHPSDWVFPVLLVLVATTGILVHIFRYSGEPMLTYVTYVVHLALAAPMLILEVPFGKWSHLYYRPLAIYFDKVKERAMAVGQLPEQAPMQAG